MALNEPRVPVTVFFCVYPSTSPSSGVAFTEKTEYTIPRSVIAAPLLYVTFPPNLALLTAIVDLVGVAATVGAPTSVVKVPTAV